MNELGRSDAIGDVFREWCQKENYGEIHTVDVMSGGKIYAKFNHVSGAKACAEGLNGNDKVFQHRRLEVRLVLDKGVPQWVMNKKH